MRFRGPLTVGASLWIVVGRNGDGSSTVLGMYHRRWTARVHRWFRCRGLTEYGRSLVTVRERRFDVINQYRPRLAGADEAVL